MTATAHKNNERADWLWSVDKPQPGVPES